MLLGGIWLQIIVLKAFHNASPHKAPYQCWHGFSNYSEKLWTVPFGNIIVSLVYSFSVEAISNFNPNLSHNFLDRYSPIPVAFALFLLEPVKPKEFQNEAYYYALKKACKSMNDEIGKITEEKQDYQEYVESFAHEIKIPIGALSLTFDNTKNYTLKK